MSPASASRDPESRGSKLPLAPWSRASLRSPGTRETHSRHLGAAETEAPLHARPQHEHEAEREDARGQRPQDEHRVVVVGDHQGLVERAFRELAENEPMTRLISG